IAGQIQDHQRTVQLLEYEIGSGQDPDLKAFASEMLLHVIQHLQMAMPAKRWPDIARSYNVSHSTISRLTV
ncbi:MAG: DUF4142 domain-containing protein, partial [Acetobacteraceae bacterium]|nr:DUF4142 domain-containing protein [Acetobacteraceae bacterium]